MVGENEKKVQMSLCIIKKKQTEILSNKLFNRMPDITDRSYIVDIRDHRLGLKYL